MQHISTTKQQSINRLTNARANWWTPLWRGLVVDPTAKHYRAMGKAIWLYLYLLLFAKRATGSVRKGMSTILAETGVDRRTLERHLVILQRTGYITLDKTEKVFTLTVQKWKPFGGRSGAVQTHENDTARSSHSSLPQESKAERRAGTGSRQPLFGSRYK